MAPLRILYVDDESDLREIVQLSLELDPSVCVQVCATGPEAINQVGAWRPHLVMLDVMMPGMDGPATLAGIRASPDCADIPAVFITARTQPAEVQQLLQLGALGVIAKPFDPLGLAGQIKGFLSRIQP